MSVLMCSLALAAAAIAAAPAAQAQAYPAKPVRLIVPYPAGGATDFFARTVFTKMSESLGQQVVVENRPGAGTAIGASEVARSTPDGYTLLLGDAGTYAFNPTLYRKLSYDPVKDFAPVSLTGRFALILAVNPAVQTASVKEFVAAAKRSPGNIDYGAPGPGSPIHLAMEFFKQRADIIMTPIPYKGGADAMTDLIGGRISAMFPDIASALPQIRGGKLRARQAGRRAARAADPRRVGLSRLRGLGLAGLRRAGGHAARRRDEAQRGVRQGDGRSSDQAAARGERLRAAHQHPGGIRRLPEERNREVGAGHPRKPHQPGLR